MATAYPGTAIDSFNAIGGANTQDESGYEHMDFHNDVNDSVVAIQTAIGTANATANTTINYKLGDISGTQKAVSNFNGTNTGTTLFGTVAGTPHYEGTPVFKEDVWIQKDKNLLIQDGTADATNPTRTVSIGGLRPTTSSGYGTITTIQFTGAGTVDLDVSPFGASSETKGFRHYTMPKSWDGGTVSAFVKWVGSGTAGASSAVFGVKALEIDTDGTIAQAHGTEGTISDVFSSTAKLQTTGAISVVPGGVAGDNGEFHFVVSRKTADGQDNYGGTAYVADVYLEYGINTYSDD